MSLNAEEKALRQVLMDGIHLDPVDVWPKVASAIRRPQRKLHRALPRRMLIPVVGLIALFCLMGAGYLNHWFVLDSNGNRTELAGNEGYVQKGGVTMQLGRSDRGKDVLNPYDWTEKADYPLGGIPLTGSSSADMIRQAGPGQLVETWNGGAPFTDVKGAYTTDYTVFQRMMENNVLQLALPDEKTLPAAYDQHTLFQAGYYLTPEDLRAAQALTSETEEGLETTIYSLPDKVKEQVSHVELCWFNAEKEGILFSANLTDSTDMLFTADESEKPGLRTIPADGFDKAVLYECYNAYYGKTERLVFLWKAVEPIETLAMGHNTTAQIAGSRNSSYILYSLDAVGLSEDEIFAIVDSL